MIPFQPKRTVANGPESKLQEAVITKLRSMEWVTKTMHGNLYQYGIPDLYCAHYQYGQRWIECKIMPYGKFTNAQLQTFKQFAAVNVGIWVVTDVSQVPEILFKPCNWNLFLSHMR